jgi:hypothetical protein
MGCKKYIAGCAGRHWGSRLWRGDGVLCAMCYVLRKVGVAEGDDFYRKALQSNAIQNFSLFTSAWSSAPC